MKIATVTVLVGMLMGAGCSRQVGWEAPSSGLIFRDTGSLFYVIPQNSSGVTFFHQGHLNSSTEHYSNPKTRTYDCSGTLTTADKVVVTYHLASSAPHVMTIQGMIYNLAQGRVFLIRTDGTVSQIPFAPLAPSEEYAAKLKEYLNAYQPIADGAAQAER